MSAADLQTAALIAKRELEERVYEATYFELTAADRAFLRAMLDNKTYTRQSDLAKRLGKNSGHVSHYKRRMLQEGIIQERAQGVLEFCLPGFKEYFASRELELGELD